MAVEATVARREEVAARAGINRKELRDIGEALLYLAPSLIMFLAFTFIPLLKSAWLSTFFTNPIGNPTAFAGLSGLSRFLAVASADVCPGKSARRWRPPRSRSCCIARVSQELLDEAAR